MIALTDFAEKDIIRFWKFVDKTDDCWIWKGGKSGSRYGFFWVNNKTVSAHRISFLLTNGTLPNELDVLHHCDNPPCVNPAHLFTGTQRDNGQDMAQKGRSAAGVLHGMSKLNEHQVSEIRKRRKNGELLRSIAPDYNVTETLISYICRRKNWKHLP